MQRRKPVTPAELLGVELRKRCGKCILWILGVILFGYTSGRLIETLRGIEKAVTLHERALDSV